MKSVFNWAMIVLVAAIVADVVLGLDTVLNAISITFAVGTALLAAVILGAVAVVVAWIVIRDAIDEIHDDRAAGRPWRWRWVGWIGIAGILVDGVIGTWNAYQEHILFSTAVERIPFAGVPVVVALASYPFKGIERFLMARRSRAR